MVLKITNLYILRYLPTYWLYLLERYTIDNQRRTHTASELLPDSNDILNQELNYLVFRIAAAVTTRS